MKVLVAVVDQGGFAAAARSLDMSPPVVTRMVAELEAHLGARLLQRSTRRFSLTETGASYLAQARDILAQLEEAEAGARASSVDIKGQLRLLAPPAFSSYLLAEQLTEFMQQYPEVSIDVSHGMAESADTGYDISILFTPELPDGDFIAHHLASTHLLLCAAPAYLRQHGEPIHPNELEQHRCIVVNTSRTMQRWQLRRVGPPGNPPESLTLEPRAVLAAPMLDPLLRAAIQGLGIASLPSFIAEKALASGELQRVLPFWEIQGFGIYAALPTRKHLPARTRAFMDFLRRSFSTDSQDDPWLARINALHDPQSGAAPLPLVTPRSLELP